MTAFPNSIDHMDPESPVKSTPLPPEVTRLVGLSCLVVGGLALIMGTSILAEQSFKEGLTGLVLGTVLIGLGIAIDRDRNKKPPAAQKEPHR